MKKMKAHKYQSNVQAKAAYLASRPKDSTYKVDETEEVFANPVPEEGEEVNTNKPTYSEVWQPCHATFVNPKKFISGRREGDLEADEEAEAEDDGREEEG